MTTQCQICRKPMNPVQALVSAKHGVCGLCARDLQQAVAGGKK